MQALGREDRSFFFLQDEVVIMVTIHYPVVVHHHQEQPEKMLRKKKSGARTSRGQRMCLSDRISDNIQNPTQKQASQKEGLGLKKIVFDLEDTKEEVCGK